LRAIGRRIWRYVYARTARPSPRSPQRRRGASGTERATRGWQDSEEEDIDSPEEALRWACMCNNATTVQDAVARGASLHAPLGGERGTALHHAAFFDALEVTPPPPPLLVLIGHAASFTPY